MIHTQENSDGIRWKRVGTEWRVGLGDKDLVISTSHSALPLPFCRILSDLWPHKALGVKGTGDKNPEGLSHWAQKGREHNKAFRTEALSSGCLLLSKCPPNFLSWQAA